MRVIIILLALLAATAGWADEADVVDVKVSRASSGAYSFEVTVRHTDEGWDHYANKWDIVDPDGAVLGTRVLYHPHVNTQPFTRELPEVAIPADIETVIIRAHDSVHDYGGREVTVAVQH